MNSLHTNGLREKNLHENVSSYIKNNYFAFSKDHEIIDIESNSNNQNAQEKMTSIIL